MADFNLGTVTAYGYARDKGYTGTEAEFAELMASYAQVAEDAAESAEQAAQSATTATTKAGEAATSATNAANANTAAQAAKTGAETAAQTATTKAGEASTSAATATSKASEATTAAATATNKATEATTAATTATTKAGEAATSATNAAASAEAAAESAATLVIDDTLTHAGQAADAKKVGDEISSLKEDKADIDGYYQDMTVGDAEQLVASQYVEDSVPYLFRTTGGSADVGNREYADGIVGGSLVWNQFNNNAGSSDTNNGITYTKNSDGSWNISGTASAESSFNFGSVMSLGANHVYLALGCPDGGSSSTYYFGMGGLVMDIGSGGMFKNTPNYASGGPNMRIKSGVTVNFTNLRFMLFDLTQMFGSTIADYIYGLETANAGAGVAWFKKLFPNMDAEYSYHEDSFDEESPLITKKLRDYQPGILLSIEGLASHDTVGFNQWDEEWEVGAYSSVNGTKASVSDRIRSKNFIPVFPSTTYYCNKGLQVYYYDADHNYIGWQNISIAGTLNTPSNAHYMTFNSLANSGNTYNHDICINLSWSGWRNGEYEAYQKHSYPLDDNLTLRGIPKLDASNNLYYGGDEYLPDGTVNRRYGVVDLGTLDWGKGSTQSGHWRFTVNLSTAKLSASSASIPNLICTKYNSASPNDTWTGTTGVTINNSSPLVMVCDEAYADAAAFKTAMSGVYLVYELATPTTETAEPYQHVQICDDFGTEEYVSTSIVPVGHSTRYPANLRDKLQHLPDLANDDGYYMIGQSNKQMHLELFRIPKAPTTDGTYILKATVSGGTPTYTWEAET